MDIGTKGPTILNIGRKSQMSLCVEEVVQKKIKIQDIAEGRTLSSFFFNKINLGPLCENAYHRAKQYWVSIKFIVLWPTNFKGLI